MDPSSRTLRPGRTALWLIVSIASLAACGIENDARSATDHGSLDQVLPDVVEPVRAFAVAPSVDVPGTVSRPAARMRNSESLSPYSGQMIGARRFDNTLMGVDLFSGRFRTLAGNPELAGIGVARSDATVVTRRDRSVHSGAVLTVDDCLDEREGTICVLFTDREGNVNTGDFFSLDGKFPGPAKTSFDGRHVVIDRSDRAAGASVLTLLTRDGEFVSSHAQNGGLDRAGAYDFLPDGRLVYSVEGNELLGDSEPTGIAITDPLDTAPRRLIRLPESYQGGRIKTIESNPDGNQLLINVEPRVGPTRPILVDLESLFVRPFIDGNDGDIDVGSVVWGPNGRWVYAVVSTTRLLSGPALDGGTVVFLGSFDSLFALRADGTTHPMPLDPGDLSDAVRVIPTDNPREPGGQVGGGQYDGNLVWIP